MKFFIYILFILIGFTSCRTSKTVKNEGERKFNHVIARDQLLEAKRLYIIGQTDSAILTLKVLLKSFPTYDVAIYELAKIYSDAKKLAPAAMLMRKAIELNGKNPWYFSLLVQLYQQLGSAQEALFFCSKWLEIDKENRNALIKYVSLNTTLKNYNQAIAAIEKLENIDGLNQDLAQEKIRLLKFSGDKARQEEELKKLIKYFPSNSMNYGLLADFYMYANRKEEAIQTYKKACEVFPDNGHLLLAYSLYLKQIDRKAESEEVLKKTFSNNSIDPEFKAQVLDKNIAGFYNMFDSTLHQKLFNEFSLQNSDNLNVIRIKANSYYTQNLYDSAIVYLEKFLKIEKNDLDKWKMLTHCYDTKESYTKLYNSAKSALELFPNEPVFYYYAGFSCYKLKKFEEGLDFLTIGTDYTLNDSKMLSTLKIISAEIYYKQKDNAKGDEIFDEILLNEPNNTLVLNNYSYYLAQRNQNLEKALEMIKKCSEIEQKNATFLDTYAWVLFKMKRFQEAKTEIENSILNGGNQRGAIVEHYGDILYKLGESENALKNWKLAKSLKGYSDLLIKKIENKQLIEE